MWQHRERLELIRNGWKRSGRSVARRTKGSRGKMCTVTKFEEILLLSDDPDVVRAREFRNAKCVCWPFTGKLTDISGMRLFWGELFFQKRSKGSSHFQLSEGTKIAKGAVASRAASGFQRMGHLRRRLFVGHLQQMRNARTSSFKP